MGVVFTVTGGLLRRKCLLQRRSLVGDPPRGEKDNWGEVVTR